MFWSVFGLSVFGESLIEMCFDCVELCKDVFGVWKGVVYFVEDVV